MSLKIEFVQLASAPGANVSALCRQYGIKRQTGHKWIKRFKESGYDGLEERSRRPCHTPLAAGEDIVVAIVESREAHPTWGPHKLRVLLSRRFGTQTPSESTIARVLKRFDKFRRRKHRPPVSIVTQAPSVDVKEPNDVRRGFVQRLCASAAAHPAAETPSRMPEQLREYNRSERSEPLPERTRPRNKTKPADASACWPTAWIVFAGTLVSIGC